MNPLIEQSVKQYIHAYNEFDIDSMLVKLHPSIVFKNISHGEVDLITVGLEAFKAQAQKAVTYFRHREQLISDLKIEDQLAEVAIDYKAILAIDLPNGMKQGETLQLKGRSVFRFENDLIISIEDYS
jgi:hypothetical protein